MMMTYGKNIIIMVLMMIPKLDLMRIFKKGWRLWAKALGEKQGNSREADKIAIWRTIIILQAIITNILISINIIITWLK
jgi:hypothetical protein